MFCTEYSHLSVATVYLSEANVDLCEMNIDLPQVYGN